MGLEVVCAYFLDLLIGDPPFPFHPVRIIGKTIQYLGKMLRRTISNEKLGGSILAIIVVGSTYVITWLILKLAGVVSTGFVFVLNILLIYFTISVRDLAAHSRAIKEELEKGNLDTARTKLSRIVGRDIELLNEDEIIRGTVESVAESTVDGIISPLFYAFIGGAPLAMAFKAVSTMDSMIGYKNEKYINFGWLGAKLDDAANFIPARLSAILIPLAARFTEFANANRAWWTIVTDGGKSNSPNAGIPEAAYAGALGIQLGGTNFYGGKKSEKPLIGIALKNRDVKDISRAINFMYIVSILTLLAGVIVGWIVCGG
ncbi:cobalamin biosynthesis protein CobD [Candidatus Desantisbacteria bacterium CG_4_10_14_0_8_um_filter_39_17]|uniref:Cobalamin biosynthesis protein CobD n=1 Tax=Candidatus Desantisbacteria bacterium CG_4_10_14_0_8_um_filter_39_17 TaxID=1974542 RepID=A0A2H9PBK3_9BACT|nr:MAG: cobalamin biosynthesis protein CobD [Candidatus Desantisbacteria bacterium CG_4_10_14_0_8_um_filter_39_17]